MQQLEKRIRALGVADAQDGKLSQAILRKRKKLAETVREQDLVAKNLARAKNEAQYEAIASEFERLSEQAQSLEKEIALAEGASKDNRDVDSAVEDAMSIVRQLPNLVNQGQDLGAARRLFELLNVRLFLRFHQVRPKRRVLNKVKGGVLTFGDADPPVAIYEGPTARNKVKEAMRGDTEPGERPVPPQSTVSFGGEKEALGNVNRGDRI